MARDVWESAIASAAVPERARHAWERLQALDGTCHLATMDIEQARIFAALASGSEWAIDWLVSHPEGTEELNPEKLRLARHISELRRKVEAWFLPLLKTASYREALDRLRQSKRCEMVRVAARDLARLATTPEIIREISDIADVCLNAVTQLCWQQFTTRFGVPYEQEMDGTWRETKFCVLGMGKLGGQELNYSSDVDVLFVYSDEGSVFKEKPRRGKIVKPGLSNHQFFTRLAEAFISEVGKLTEGGMLYRIDLRLRPEGAAGPLARSLASYENHYAQAGQTWERMMLIKARRVAGDETVAGEFLEMVQPFRYPRSLGENVLKEIAATKLRIESEVAKRGGWERNVKLGRGGIREIEFIVQALQLLHGGRNPFLQGAQTLPALQKLKEYQLLSSAGVETLTSAYLFLRDVEHRLQMDHDRQTHTLPSSPADLDRIARLMGFASAKTFERARVAHCRGVRSIYEKLLTTDQTTEPLSLPKSFNDLERWKTILATHSFRDPSQAVRLLKEFALGPGFGHISQRTTELALPLISKLLSMCPKEGQIRDARKFSSDLPPPPESRSSRGKEAPSVSRDQSESPYYRLLSDPDRVVARLDTFVAAYGARTTLFEVWSSNPLLFELMLFLFDRSEFLAEVAIRTPDLVDDLVLSGHLRKRKDAPAILEELRHGAHDEDQRLWFRRYHRSELMRIGLRDIVGLADYEQNFEELTALADASLQYGIEIITRKHRLKSPPFAIIGWGKLGGRELNYGSDLDITFVAPEGAKQMAKLQRLAVEMMEIISSPTVLGVAFEVDTRLRPDGEKGLLVNTVSASREYYQKRAQLWEIQSLTQTRFIAGDSKTGQVFHAMAAELTDFSQTPSVEAFTPDWKQQIAQMRTRIEKERTPAGKNALAIKTGTGGLMDAEFIAQFFALQRGWMEANTLHALRRAEEEKGLKKRDTEKLIENYRKLRRVEAILRRWSYASETMLPDDPAPLYRVAVRCGFADADSFMDAVSAWRKAIREVYLAVFS
jgi:[glutamine synthetase] adenylyltransferase / [glutamine synthetase]-adenylyl-L-tyrosine phosphorylase